MKLTPLDIHHKEFNHSLRGYNEEQVDAFLDEVADEFERLFKENIELTEKLEAAQERLNEFESQRQTINNTLMAAQRSAEDIIAKAQAEAETILKDAEVKAKEIIHNALSKKQQVAGELVRIKQAEEEFRAKFRALLEGHLRSITEIGLPADVDVLVGETGAGIIGDVAVRPAEPAPGAGDVDTSLSPDTTGVVAAEEPATPVAAAPEQPGPPAAEVPSPGFVQAVHLGEVGEPDVPEDLTLPEPEEFTVPRLESLGEADDELEIEEID